MDKELISNMLSIEEQIELLISKGIEIENRSFAYRFLEKNNYYSVMKLRCLLYEKNSSNEYIDHKYRHGVTFDEIVNNYENNIRLYYELYGMIGEPIRYYKNEFIKKWVSLVGDFTQEKYLLNNYYNDSAATRIILDIMNKKEILEYQYKHGFVPIWIIVDAMSEIQFCYLLLYSKKNIIKEIFVTENVKKIVSWLLDMIWLCEERTPILDKRHIVSSIEEFCANYRKNIEKSDV